MTRQTKIACIACGATILWRTADDNDGKCLPCSRGQREQLEAGRALNRRMREEWQAYEKTPERKFWLDLVRRTSIDPSLLNLSPHERTYFLANCFYGEIYNGGFEQFFTNSSGDHYAETLLALCDVGDVIAADFLREAKQLIFGSEAVPSDQSARWFRADALTEEQQQALDVIFRQLIAHADAQADKLAPYACAHNLF